MWVVSTASFAIWLLVGWGRRAEAGGQRGQLIYPPSPFLQGSHRLSGALTQRLQLLSVALCIHLWPWVQVTSASPPFRPRVVTAPPCCQPGDMAPSLLASLHPAHVFVNRPLIKRSSNYSISVHHLFPARALIMCDLYPEVFI